MIKIYVGNPGSGKTLCCVRDMFLNKSRRKTFSNIMTHGIKNNILLRKDMIVKEKIIGYKKSKDKQIPIIQEELNMEFWQKIKDPINCIIDEAHNIMNSRRSMSKLNIIIGNWLALIRRVLGSSGSNQGELILITQLVDRIDLIARDMARNIRYFRCHYVVTCKKCGYSWKENNDVPEQSQFCKSCGHHDLIIHSHKIEVWHFRSITDFETWKERGYNTYHKRYLILDPNKYFDKYNTLQWENLFT